MLDASQADAFAPFYRAAAQARVWRRWTFGLAGLVALQAASLSVLALRPPWVIVHDRVEGRLPSVRQLQLRAPADVVGARLFFTQMVQLRYGWQSGTVRRDIEGFLLQCHPTHRRAQLQHLVQTEDGAVMQPAPAGGRRDLAPSRSSRLQQWERAGLTNRLVLPEHWDEVQCRARPQEAVWDCAMTASLLTTLDDALQSEGLGGATSAQPVTFVGTFFEVPPTVQTPHGLLVAHLDLVAGALVAPATAASVAAGEGR